MTPSTRKTSRYLPADGERGASMIEYALLVALIAIIAIAAINLTGNEVSSTFREIASELN